MDLEKKFHWIPVDVNTIKCVPGSDPSGDTLGRIIFHGGQWRSFIVVGGLDQVGSGGDMMEARRRVEAAIVEFQSKGQL